MRRKTRLSTMRPGGQHGRRAARVVNQVCSLSGMLELQRTRSEAVESRKEQVRRF